MADFNWYLNRQGLTGHKGDKGDQGFAPYFTVETSTANVYKLRVHNENDSFVTDNLRGNAIKIVNPDGTYIKYDKLTGDFYVDTADIASTDIVGQVRLATLQDVEVLSNDTAITPELLADTLPIYLVNTDGNISIAQRDEDSKTVINLSDSFNEHLSQDFVTVNTDQTITGIKYIDGLRTTHNYGYISTGNFGHDANWTVRLRNTSSNPDYPVIDGILNTNTQDIVINSSTGKVELNSSVKNKINNVIADLNTEISMRESLGYQLQAQIDNERSERETQDSALQAALNSKLTADNIKAGTNITITKDGNSVTISSAGEPLPKNLVTTDTTQTITGQKTFSKQVNVPSGILRAADNRFIIEGQDNKDVMINNLLIHKGTWQSSLDCVIKASTNADLVIDQNNDLAYISDDSINPKHYYPKAESFYSSDGSIYINPEDKGKRINLRAIGGGGGGAIIDDEDVSTSKVFSSSKTSELVGEVGNNLQDLTQRVNNIESLKVPNVVIIGEPTIQEGQVSNIDENNHLQLPFVLDREGRNWECDLSFTTGDDITTQQNIIDSRCSIALAVRNSDLVLALSTNGTAFNLGEHIMPDFLLQPNTTYYVRISYISNMGYVLEADVNPITYGSPHLSIGYPDSPIAARTLLIGSDGNSFSGTLDLNKWSLKLNNELIWLGMDNVGQAVSANVSLSNINEAGKEVIREVSGVGNIEEALNLLNGGDSTLLDSKQNKLVAGEGITIDPNTNVISATGGGTGSGDMTTNTEQNVTGAKTFIGETLKLGNSNGETRKIYLSETPIGTKTGYSATNTYIDVNELMIGQFGKYRISFEGGFHSYYSPYLDIESVKAGNNITVTQDETDGSITISATGGSNYTLPKATTTTLGGICAGNWLKVNEDTGKLECGELSKSQYDSALGYTFISKTTLNNVLADYIKSNNIKTINGESIIGTGNIEVEGGGSAPTYIEATKTLKFGGDN